MSHDDSRPEADRAGHAKAPRQTTALFGHDPAQAELLEGYRRGKLAQAWIIGGPEGIGKATLRRLAHLSSAAPFASRPRSPGSISIMRKGALNN